MNFRMTIVGIGGVGGVLAGPLVRKYGGAVSLIARGTRGEHLRTQGLTLHSDLYGEFTVQPETVVESAAELPIQDYVLVCVKNDALPKVIEQIQPIVDEHTVVVPVMNGVTAVETLEKGLAQGKVAGSVIYTVSSAGTDYAITQTGKFTHLFLDETVDGAKELCRLLVDAGVDCRLTGDIKTAMWSKYVFNCAYNTMTAAEATDAGHLKEEPLRADFEAILAEAGAVGRAYGAVFGEDMVEREMRRLDKTVDRSTSSLSRDFDARRAGEMEVFSGDLVRMAAGRGMEAPTMQRYYAKLQEKAKTF